MKVEPFPVSLQLVSKCKVKHIQVPWCCLLCLLPCPASTKFGFMSESGQDLRMAPFWAAYPGLLGPKASPAVQLTRVNSGFRVV